MHFVGSGSHPSLMARAIVCDRSDQVPRAQLRWRLFSACRRIVCRPHRFERCDPSIQRECHRLPMTPLSELPPGGGADYSSCLRQNQIYASRTTLDRPVFPS
jgi:hypothetical protein